MILTLNEENDDNNDEYENNRWKNISEVLFSIDK